MKKIFLLITVLLFTFVLGGCSGLEDKYPETNAEGEQTFTLVEVEDLIDEAIAEYDEELNEKFEDYGGVDGVQGFIDSMDDFEDYIYSEFEDLNWAVNETAEILSISFEYLLWMNDENTIIYEQSGNDYDDQFEQLSNAYYDYLIENYPDYFSEEDRENDTVVFVYNYEDWSITVEYEEYYRVIVIESVEVCGDICEAVDFTQTDFVITVDELETHFRVYLEFLYNQAN